MDIKTKFKIQAIAWWVKGLLEPGSNKRKDLTGIYLGKKLKEVLDMEETKEVKSKWLSKTLWFNLLVGLAGLLTALTTDKGLDPQTIGYATTALGFVNIVLRFLTTQPMK